VKGERGIELLCELAFADRGFVLPGGFQIKPVAVVRIRVVRAEFNRAFVFAPGGGEVPIEKQPEKS
jgi:hypothetical protein